MLTAYFDESGTHKDSKVFVIGGYVADDLQWEKFTEMWCKILSDFGLQDFHMTDFENRRKHFKHLSNSERRILISRLIGCMKVRIRIGFATAFYASTLNKIIEKGYQKELGSNYF
jgi:hypothetical protein